MKKADSSRRIQLVVWSGLTLIILFILIAFLESKLRTAGSSVQLPIISQVPEFTLTNQSGQQVTLAALAGQVWIADIIFTRCAGPCPQMTRRMAELQSALASDDPVKLVTLTTDPDFDTPDVLHHYGRRFDADPDRWVFLTGTKSEIVRVAVDGLKLTAIEKDPAERESDADLFIHSTIFVLVDKHGRLRGVFETSEPAFGEDGRPLADADPQQTWEENKSRILDAVSQLLAED